MKIYLASGNKGKIAEVSRFFPNAEVISQKQLAGFHEPEENGKSFEENSLIKARALYNFLHDVMNENDIIIADDSGLLVPALGNNKLGVYTKRQMISWTSENECEEKDFWNHVVKEAGEGAIAEFPAAISVIDYNGKEFSFKYVLEGKLASPRGENGFAFDTIVLYDGKTLAEMTADEKQLVSPRAKALEQVAKKFA